MLEVFPFTPAQVDSEQIGLLKHPLVTSLLDYKWTTYVQYVYFGNLFVYLLFLSFLTAFALVVLNPLSCTCESLHACIRLRALSLVHV